MWKKCCCLCAKETYEPPDVQELDYRHSSLTEVPPEIFTYERTLEKLRLGSNQICDLPPNLFYCHELRELDICDNELKEIPAAIESLTRLAKLNVCRNALTEVPESIKNCKNLTHLDLSLNQLSKIPEAICQLVHLEELFLNETALDFLPANFGRLMKLKNLELRDNTIVSLPMSMNRLNQLQRLDIGCNEMEELPTVIGSMTNLLELWADDNAMRQDANSKVLGNLPKLTCIDMSKNSITSISEQIGKCSNLTDITFSYNDLPEMPSSFTKLEDATTIRIDNNRISQLPEDLGKLKNLQELVVSCNLLKSIPLSIGLLRKLHTLYLDDNRLTELPKEIGSCVSLSVLSVANNSLKEIPSEIGHLSNLRVLILTNNLIRNLPVSILGLTNLGALWLTEGQNKPLVTLNREIDSATGQHVVTCCLLPQLPSPDVVANRDTDPEESTPRRSGRKIRFETDVEPPVPEKPAANGGLLRAPTPYPKELRAMAKHASHIRQAKNQNGEAINISDEPMYEGDMNEDSTDYQTKQNFELKMVDERHQDNQAEQYHIRQKLQHDNIPNTFKNPQKEPLQYPMSSSSVTDNPNSTINSVNTSSTTSNLREFSYQPPQPSQQQSVGVQPQQVEEGAPPQGVTPSASSSFAAVGRTPPPYHIAAQRAAFFRSSGGAGTGKINFPSGEIKNSEVVTTTGAMNNHHASHSAIISPDTPPISPDFLGGGMNPSYEPMIVTSLPQSSSNSNYTNNNSNDQDSSTYEPANVNAILLQYQNHHQSGVPPLMTSNVSDNGIMVLGGVEMNDNLGPGGGMIMMDSTASNTATSSNAINSNPIGYTNQANGGIQSDRNGNITTANNKTVLDDHHHIHHYVGNAGGNMYASHQDDACRDAATVPPAMPLLMESSHNISTDVTPQIKATSSSASPTSSQSNLKATKLKTPESKICRIPSLQSAPAGKRYHSTSHVISSNPPSTPSRLPAVESSASESHGMSNTSHLRNAHQEFQYGGGIKAASTSRIPGGMMYYPSSSEKRPTGIPPPKRNAAISQSNIKFGGGGGGVSSGIPRIESSSTNNPAIGGHHQDQSTKSYSRIPKLEAPTPPRALPEDMSFRSSSSTDEEKRSAYSSSGASEKSLSRGISPKLSRSGAGRESDHMVESKIPMTRKPWIFGSHRNARVVSLEHTKVNQFTLGFSITEFTGPMTHPDGKGIYVTAADSEDLPVKVGDKILQVDGIDVGDMGVEIVNKILGNCQENIQLLVSRQQ